MRISVEEAISEGCNAIEDIVDQTGLEETAVKRIYRELITDGGYEERPMGFRPDHHNGQRKKGIFAKSSAPGNSCRVVDDSRTSSHYYNPDEDD